MSKKGQSTVHIFANFTHRHMNWHCWVCDGWICKSNCVVYRIELFCLDVVPINSFVLDCEKDCWPRQFATSKPLPVQTEFGSQPRSKSQSLGGSDGVLLRHVGARASRRFGARKRHEVCASSLAIVFGGTCFVCLQVARPWPDALLCG